MNVSPRVESAVLLKLGQASCSWEGHEVYFFYVSVKYVLAKQGNTIIATLTIPLSSLLPNRPRPYPPFAGAESPQGFSDGKAPLRKLGDQLAALDPAALDGEGASRVLSVHGLQTYFV